MREVSRRLTRGEATTRLAPARATAAAHSDLIMGDLQSLGSDDGRESRTGSPVPR